VGERGGDGGEGHDLVRVKMGEGVESKRLKRIIIGGKSTKPKTNLLLVSFDNSVGER